MGKKKVQSKNTKNTIKYFIFEDGFWEEYNEREKRLTDKYLKRKGLI